MMGRVHMSVRDRTRGRVGLGLVVAIALLMIATACSQGTEPPSGGSGEPSGEVQMWLRDATEAFTTPLVEKFNETHDVQIKMTVIPDTQYVTKVSTSAASGELPDLLSVDLIYMPDFINSGIMADITDDVQALEFVDELAPSHVDIAEQEDKNYGVPYWLDVSTLYYNKDLFKKAGLNPDEPPKTWDEIESAAKAINGLGGDVSGFYFAGNCAGCNAFTFLPLVWAQGADVITEEGQPTLDTEEMRSALEFYKSLWDQGLAPRSAQSENGETWATTFAAGNIGIAFYGSFALEAIPAENPKLEFGTGLIPGPDGDGSSFGGGDVLGITSAADNPEGAWEFIDWMLSEETQVEIIAKADGQVARSDLTDNTYAAKDPNVQTHNEAVTVSKTPETLGYNELFNDPNGPWLTMLQTAIFDGDIEGAMSEGESEFERIIESATN
jgi:multiple sugar transport system substrate-binding protein